MIVRILRFLGYPVVDLAACAQAIAEPLLTTYTAADLDPQGTMLYLQRKYAELAAQTGLPMDAQRAVAQQAWDYIAKAHGWKKLESDGRFSFYD